MRWGRIGGLIIIGGALLAVPAAALSGPAGPSDDPNLRHVNLLMNASLALFGSGVGVLGVFGPRPFGGRGIRIGLGALGVGLLSFVVFLTIPIPPGSNDLSYGPTAYSGIIAVVATVVGLLMVGIWLLRATGLARAVGVLFLVALSLPVLAVPFNGDTGAGSTVAFLIAPILLVLGALGIAVMAIRAERSAPAASA